MQTKTDQDCSKKLLRMVATVGSHYGIILETKKKRKISYVMFVEEQIILAYRNARSMSPEPSSIIDRVVNDCL